MSSFQRHLHHLPIDAALPDLRRALRGAASAVLQAPPGAGKTTRVPIELLDEPWLQGRRILMLEPRRLAARAAAAYMAAELGEAVGQTVGYRIRFESRVSAATRIEVITEGILTRRLQSDPELEGVGLVIFDEFHERSLHSDLALALCLDSQAGLRDDLRLLLMSATLDGQRLASHLAAPLVQSEGRAYPVDVRYRAVEVPGHFRLPEAIQSAVVDALREEDGDILVFLPGVAAIRRSQALLEAHPACAGITVHGLYGDMPMAAQQAAITPDARGRRKVVLATTIAETSLTIEGIRVVIDGGWQRVPRFDPRSGLGRLETVRVSQASATQRCGRAGRLGPGVCYRLWGEGVQQGLVPFNSPEIRVSDLVPLALELALWGISDPAELTWFDEPPKGHMAQAHTLLRALDALDDSGRITAIGRAMAELPLHPRLAHMVLRGRELGMPGVACDLAALLAESDVLRQAGAERRCDFSRRIDALRLFRDEGKSVARELGADVRALGVVDRAARQWRRQLRADDALSAMEAQRHGLLLAQAYPDRIARRRSGQGERYLLANGRGAQLLPECALAGYEWLVVAELDGAGDDSRIRSAMPFDPDLFRAHFHDSLTPREVVAWDRRQGSVRAERIVGFGAIALERRALEKVSPERMGAAMLDGIRQLGLAALPWSDEASGLRQRVLFLRACMPEDGWPDWSDATLMQTVEAWLLPYLNGCTRREHLARLDMHAILLGMLGWERRQRLDEGAPTHITVPSGNRRRIEYSNSDSPVLAVKLQELFGLADTPTLAWGRVPLTLHLLSPAQRPIQVTRDLRGFWDRTYTEVKKELKGRYPKHPWPDDPWNAKASAGVKRRP